MCLRLQLQVETLCVVMWSHHVVLKPTQRSPKCTQTRGYATWFEKLTKAMQKKNSSHLSFTMDCCLSFGSCFALRKTVAVSVTFLFKPHQRFLHTDARRKTRTTLPQRVVNSSLPRFLVICCPSPVALKCTLKLKVHSTINSSVVHPPCSLEGVP